MDPKAIVTDGFWMTDYTQLPCFVVTDGYVGQIDTVEIQFIYLYFIQGVAPFYESTTKVDELIEGEYPMTQPAYEVDILNTRTGEKADYDVVKDYAANRPREWRKFT